MAGSDMWGMEPAGVRPGQHSGLAKAAARRRRYNPFYDEEVEHFPALDEVFAPGRTGGQSVEFESLWSPESQAVLYGEDFSLHNETADGSAVLGQYAEDEAAQAYWETHAFTRTPLSPAKGQESGNGTTERYSRRGGHGRSSAATPLGGPGDGGRARALAEIDRNRWRQGGGRAARETFYVRDLLDATSAACRPPPACVTPDDERNVVGEVTGDGGRHRPISRLQERPPPAVGSKATRAKAAGVKDTRRREEMDASLPLDVRTLLLLQRVERAMQDL